MSGICGIVNFDGAPVDPELLRKMAEAAAYRGPDGIRYWIEGNVGFAHLALNTTPESLRERQPLVNRRGDLVLTADARVDNRDELIRILTSKGYIEDKDPTDVDLILASYEGWGEDCPRHIIGDFAFAIWDKREQRLFAAKDPLGIRPMFYSKNGQNLIIGSAISMILAGLSTRPPMNDYFIVDFLCWRFDRWIDETIWQDVLRLPRSFSLIANQDRLDLIQNWFFGQGPTLSYKRDEEYVEHFRELFAEAIRVRSRSISDVGVSMSGGLDSSSIAAMAHHMVEIGSIENTQYRLYSVAFSRFPSADERIYQDTVAEKCHLFPYTKIDGDQIWGFQEFGADNGFPLDEPEIFPIRSMLTRLIKEAKSDGCKVVLSGEGGDQVMNSAAYWNPSLFLEMSIRDLPVEFKHFWKRSKFGLFKSLAFDLVINSTKYLVPRSIIGKFRQLRRRSTVPGWINSKVIGFSSGTNGHLSLSMSPRRLGRSAVQMHSQLTGGWYSSLVNYLDMVIASSGMEYRYPFLDRIVIDFMLKINPSFKFTRGVTKVILRSSMNGLLPDLVCNRIGACRFSDISKFGIKEKEIGKVDKLMKRLHVSKLKYIEIEKFDKFWLENFMYGSSYNRSFMTPLVLQSWMDTIPSDI